MPNEIAMSYEIVAGAGLLLLISIGVVIWRRLRRSPFERELVNLANTISDAELTDILVPDGMGGEIHIERLLRTSTGFLLLDTRDMQGNIFAGEHMHEWHATHEQKRIVFDNPIPGLLDRLAALRAVIGGVPIEGKIVFRANASFPKGHPDQVTTTTAIIAAYANAKAPVSRAYTESWQQLQSLIQG